jgi:hypothetical protein
VVVVVTVAVVVVASAAAVVAADIATDRRLPPGPKSKIPGRFLLALHRDRLGFFAAFARD